MAPSPTGALHLGNARTFLINWALARRNGWRIVLRIEDLDGPRVKPEAVTGIIRTLEWLGIDWDEGPHVQSHEPEPHAAAIRQLASRGKAYPCSLTRAEIEAAASAPQAGTHEVRYPASLRPAIAGSTLDFDAYDGQATNWRFLVPAGDDAVVEFEDAVAGRQRIDVAAAIGDFVIWTKRSQPAYQLAVVVDDARQEVTDVVRGDDLLESAARQVLLYRALGAGPIPTYCHLPLVVGQDGLRLAKRHGDTRVDTYRALGVPRDAVIGLIASWSGIETGSRDGAGGCCDLAPMDPREFMDRFSLDTMSRDQVIFTQEHDAWLRSQARGTGSE